MSQKALPGIFVMAAGLLTPVQRPFNTWKSYGGGVDSSQYSSLMQIDKTNVKQLQVAWTFPIGENSSTSPLIVDNVMYVSRAGQSAAIFALGARGMNYWENADRSDRRLVFVNNEFRTYVLGGNSGFGD